MRVSLNPVIAVGSCKHCDQPISSERRGDFCCNGCETVYALLNQSGLGEYYRIKDQGICVQAPKPAANRIEKFSFQTDVLNVKFFLEGIHCSACLWLLEKLPRVIPEAVKSCSLNLNTSILSVELRSLDQINAVARTINEWGYVPHLISNLDQAKDKIETENRRRLLDLGIAGALTSNVMLLSIPLYSGVSGSFESLFEYASFILAIPSLFYSGRVFFKNVYSGFKSKTFPIDAPILLALLVAFGYSTVSLIQGTHQLYFDSLTALVFLLLSSRYYLARLRQSSHLNLGVLDFFQADFDGKSGDLIRLNRGEKIQFDGVVRKGEGWADHSHFTGESEPVHLQAGDPVYAGTELVGYQSEVWVEVQKTGKQTRLAHLLQKVSEAQSARTQTELRSDFWASKLLIVVSSIAMFSLVYFIAQGQAAEGVKRVLALLIVTCPCALALATPLVFTLAMKSLLKKGLLIKDPGALDRAPEIKTIFFDKTGTLTEGRLHAAMMNNDLGQDEWSALFSMVRQSNHPAAKAVERAIVEREMLLPVLALDSLEEKAGLGIFAGKDGHHYSLIRSPKPLTELTESVFLADGEERLRIQFMDSLRSETIATVSELKKRGLEVQILSGDHDAPVKRAAFRLGADGYSSLQTPEDKARKVHDSIMVGDGVNDALALSSARVSLAVQGGMGASIQSSQVYSMKPGVQLVVPFVDMAMKVRRVLRQNFILSTSYNLAGAILSLSGHMSPLIAAILMPASALTVFWSSVLRLKERE